MRRLVVPVVLVATIALLSSCGLISKSYAIQLEVTGSGKADQIKYSFPGDKKHGAPSGVALPWNESASTGFGFIHLDVKAGNDPVTCKIVVNGKEVDKKEAKAGETAQCYYSAQDN